MDAIRSLVCVTCKKCKSIDEFWKDKKHRTGRQSECKTCMRQRSSRYHVTHREKRISANLATVRRRRDANPAAALLKGVKDRARRDGIEFSLVMEDIIPLPTTCPVLGIELVPRGGSINQETGKRGAWGRSPSIDRIDPSKGYTKDNIIVISWRANRIKCDATPEELRAVARFFTQLSEERENA